MSLQERQPFDFTSRNPRMKILEGSNETLTLGNLALKTNLEEEKDPHPVLSFKSSRRFVVRNLINPVNGARLEEVFAAPEQKEFTPIKITPGLGKGTQLAGTGINLPMEEKAFIGDYNQARISGNSHQEALEIAKKGKENNIRTGLREYGQLGTVIPMLIAEGEDNGVKGIVNSYGGERIVKKITDQERNGAVLAASIQAEEFMNNLEGEGMFIINSPRGWTGLTVDGEPFRYTKGQILVMFRENGVLSGVTLVNDFKIEESEQFSAMLGINPDILKGETEEENISNIVSNPIPLKKGSTRFNTPQDIVDTIVSFRPDGLFHFEEADGNIRDVPVSDMLRDIGNREQLLRFSKNIEDQWFSLEAFIDERGSQLEDFSIQHQIAAATAKAILNMFGHIFEDQGLITEFIPQELPDLASHYRYTPSEPFVFQKSSDYSDIRTILKARGGCNPQMESSKSISDLIKSPLEVLSNMGLAGALSRLGGSFGSPKEKGGSCSKCQKNQAVECGVCNQCMT